MPGLDDFDRYVAERGVPRSTTRPRSLSGSPNTGAPLSRFEKVELVEPADGVVIEGDEL